MNSLDRELKNALRREEPSVDFAARVLACLPPSPVAKPGWRVALRHAFRLPTLRWAAVGTCLALVFGLVAYHHHQNVRRAAALARQAEGELARAQVMIALRITSSKLNVVMREVRQRNLHPRVQSVPKI